MSAARIRLLLALVGLVAPTPLLAGSVTKLRDVGPDDNRLVIAIAGDGYLATSEAQFLADAEQALEGLLAESPYLEYAAWINVYADFVPSAEEGADKPSPCFASPVERDTAFDATYCTGGTRRLLTVDAGTVFTLFNAEVPSWDFGAVVVNDAEYGGAGGSVLTFSTDSGAMVELFLHEAGHTFGRLADEYVSYSRPYPGAEPSEPNVTKESDRSTTKWSPWIEDGTPLPTPPSLDWTVGLYEGARYYETGIYRPVDDCRMRSLNRSFCPVCKESHVQELHARVSALDGATPPPGAATVPPCEAADFHLELLPIEANTLVVEWLLDGLPLPGEDGPELRLDAALVPPGGARLEARIVDATPLVRRPYRSPMTALVTWDLDREVEHDLDGDGLDDACDPDDDGDGVADEADCAPRDAAIGAPARELAWLRVERAAGGRARLSWEDLVALESRPDGAYAIVSGLLGELHSDRGFDRACRLPHDATPELLDERGLPATEPAAHWYLVAVEDACGAGGLGLSSPGAPERRGLLEPAALPDCP